MKTPREVAHADTVGHAAVAWCGFGRGGDTHSLWCDSRTQALERRDAEHAASSSVAWEALERIARVNDLLGNAVGHGHDEETCGMCRAIDIARAALALRPGGKP